MIYSIVTRNLMKDPAYTPYCGNNLPAKDPKGCSNPRTVFNGEQFVCLSCGFKTDFSHEFIQEYKAKWNK